MNDEPAQDLGRDLRWVEGQPARAEEIEEAAKLLFIPADGVRRFALGAAGEEIGLDEFRQLKALAQWPQPFRCRRVVLLCGNLRRHAVFRRFGPPRVRFRSWGPGRDSNPRHAV